MAFRRTDALSLGVLGLAAGATVVVYDQLPVQMATHFDLHGVPNGWMPREVGAWFGPVFGVAIWAVVRYLPRVLPLKGSKPLAESKAALVASFTALFMAFVHVLLLWVALVPGASLISPMWVGVGALSVALGLVMPRVGRNAFVGIRTAWTLASDENWARTHRLAGYSMVLGGLVCAIVGFVGGSAGAVLALTSLLVSVIVPVIYSAVLARRHV
jgi:uncharacterized membrane protein